MSKVAPILLFLALCQPLMPQVVFGQCAGTLLVNEGIDEPLDLPTGPQPSSWTLQRSQLKRLDVIFGDRVLETVDTVRLTSFGMNGLNWNPDFIEIPNEYLTLTSERLRIDIPENVSFEPGMYELEVRDSFSTLLQPPTSENRLYVLPGDWNGDQGVSIFDFSTLAYWFSHPTPLVAPSYVDLNRDNGVSIFDFSLLADYFEAEVTYPPNISFSMHDHISAWRLSDLRLSGVTDATHIEIREAGNRFLCELQECADTSGKLCCPDEFSIRESFLSLSLGVLVDGIEGDSVYFNNVPRRTICSGYSVRRLEYNQPVGGW